MSILLVELVPQGIIFGADRNISVESKKVTYEDKGEERPFIEQHHYHYYQSPRPKVLRWPSRKALIGYVTNDATLGGMPTDEWLYDFIGDHLNFSSFEDLAESLRKRVEEQRRIDEGNNEPEPFILHLGGFEERQGIQVPIIWVIRNAHDPTGMDDWRKEFIKKEAFWSMFEHSIPAKDIRAYLAVRAITSEPFWFHQGFDLGTFNLLESFLKTALKELHLNKPVNQRHPQTLLDWERQVRMSILTYGAYFQAYKEPYEQYVGGGADTVSIPWPE